MKTKILITVFSFLLISGYGYNQNNYENDYLGLPGDNLNLYATLKLFQESETLELFEKNLNDENTKINNLDLNGDNRIDYIRVIDNVDNNVHVITLQVAVNKYENQDVAVIVVQKDNEKIQIQLIGDEDLYGKDYIIEPNYNDENSYSQTPNPGYTGNNNYNDDRNTIVINHYTYSEVSLWPMVRFIYAPVYRPWHSQWHWGYYPTYWRPWNPYYWHYYWGYHYHWRNNYYGHYRHSNHHRYSRWNDYYYGHRRTYSSTVRHRNVRGEYKTTYSRPDLAEKGSESYRKTYPNSPSARVKLPDIKQRGNERILNPYENRKSSGNYQKNNNAENYRKGNSTNQRTTNPYENKKQTENKQNYSKPENYNRATNNNQEVKRTNNNYNNNASKGNQNAVKQNHNNNNYNNRANDRSNNNYQPRNTAPRQSSTPTENRQNDQKSKNKSERRN